MLNIPLNAPASLLNGQSLLDTLGEDPNTFQPGDADALQDMYDTATTAQPRWVMALQEALRAESDLRDTWQKLGAMKTQASQKLQAEFLRVMDEGVSNGSACDWRAYAVTLEADRSAIALLQDTEDLVQRVRMPAARLARLEATFGLRKFDALIAALAAALAHCRIIESLTKAGIFSNSNRVALISEEVEALRSHAREAQRQADQAEQALQEERARQVAAEQIAVAHGTITRAQVAAAIPVVQGS
ncbi:MAG: hypothetical protein WCB12_22595 [Bryobacteraceae bacterium]